MPSMKELLTEQIKELEENLRLIEIRMSEYVLSTDRPLGLLKEMDRIKDELEQKKVQLASLEAASTPEPGPAPLELAERVKNIHVDRQAEEAEFRAMIEEHSKRHVLFIEAESGMGKSALLRRFTGMVEKVGLPLAQVDFRNPGRITFGEIFRELCDQLRELKFPNFHEQSRRLVADAGLAVGSQTLLCSFVDRALDQRPPEDRETDRQMLIDVFLSDLDIYHELYPKPVVLMFDTFEKVNAEVQAWMSEQFISRVRRYPWLICVVAGQKTPKIESDVDWCAQSTLTRLLPKHIREYLQQIRLEMSEDLIIFITRQSKGIPSALQQLALTLAGMEQ